jgi:hypothetical protein
MPNNLAKRLDSHHQAERYGEGLFASNIEQLPPDRIAISNMRAKLNEHFSKYPRAETKLTSCPFDEFGAIFEFAEATNVRVFRIPCHWHSLNIQHVV